jgi:hypothetical protein
MFTYTALAFFPPFAAAALATSTWWHDYVSSWARMIPCVLWPTHGPGIDNSKLLSATSIMSSLLNHVLVIVTFGICSPILAVVIFFTIVISTYMWQIIIGRYIQQRKLFIAAPQHYMNGDDLSSGRNLSVVQPEHSNHLFLLEKSCIGVWLGPQKAVWAIVDWSCIFHAVVYTDLAGSWEQTFRYFFAIFMPLICMPIVLRICFRGQVYCRGKKTLDSKYDMYEEEFNEAFHKYDRDSEVDTISSNQGNLTFM